MKIKNVKNGENTSGLKDWFHWIFSKIKKIFVKTRKLFTPDQVAWKSASIGVVIIIIILLLIFAFLYLNKLGILISGLSVVYFSLTGVLTALG